MPAISHFTYILYANAGRKKYIACAYRNYRHFTQQCLFNDYLKTGCYKIFEQMRIGNTIKKT